MGKRLSLILFILIGLGHISAQAQIDTLALAKKLRDKGKYKKASGLLKAYHKKNPKDINALWLYAQTEFWRRHFHSSQKLYEAAVMLQPDKDLLTLDYAHSLIDMGEWKKADKVIAKLEKQGKAYSDQLLMRAKISYYKGDYKKASKEALVAIDSNTKSWQAKQLYYDVLLAKSPWIKFGTSYTTDNQPMQTILPSVEAGIFLHPYSTLNVGFYSPIFIRHGSVADAQMATVGNTSSFTKIGLLVKADIGFDKFPEGNKISWIGDVYLQKTFAKYLVFDAFAEHRAYLYTYSSIDSALSVGHFVTSLGWNDQNFINGKAGLDFNYFANGNYVFTLYGYAYAPPIKFSFVQLRLGYSYSYSNSKLDDYSSTRPLDTIIKNFVTNPTVSGVYDPFFTPNRQQIHSALIALRLNPVKTIEVGATASIGFYAYTQNPYLYLDKNASSEVYIARGYSREGFVPVDAGAYVQWSFAKKYSLKADYRYRSTYFYSSHTAGLSFKMSIWN